VSVGDTVIVFPITVRGPSVAAEGRRRCTARGRGPVLGAGVAARCPGTRLFTFDVLRRHHPRATGVATPLGIRDPRGEEYVLDLSA
jgi:hypothetical protein